MNLDEYIAMQEKPDQSKEAPIIPAVETEPVVEEKPVEPDVPTTFKVGDKELTIDELTQGYLRQSDYTKKTTDISRMKDEYQQALAVYNMIQDSPDLQEKLKEAGGDKALIDSANAEHKRIQDLESKIASMELNSTISELKGKYSDFDETVVINEAAKRGTTDLEFVYKATRSIDNKEGDEVDIDALKKQLLEELRAEQGTVIPPTMMDGKAPAKQVTTPEGPVMTKQEAKIADGMGISHADYIKQRDAQ